MSDFISPVVNARLTSKFGWRNLGFGKEWHQGIDLASTGKVPIYASADGIVIRTGILSSYGNVVMIRHNINGKRMDTNYAHLDSYCVKVGQTVKQGQQIGIMGMTGRSYGIHLHFEIHNGAWATGQPNAVDPMKYISLKDDISVIAANKGDDLTVSQYQELKKEIEELRNELNKKAQYQVEGDVGESHKDGYEWATREGLTNGSNPRGALTRQQMFSVLKNFYDKVINK